MDRRREDDLLGLLAATCIAVALLFAKISAEVLQGDHTGLDQSVRQFAMSHQYGSLTAFFQVVTMVGDKEILVPLTLISGWFLSRRDKVVAILFILLGFVAAEFVDVLKDQFRVERPLAGLRLSRSFSFPSGHSSGAATMLTMLSYVAWRENRGKARVPVLVSSVVFVLLVAASRVYLDRHWLTDVVAGVLIGIALGLACCALYELIERRRRLRRVENELG